jgi:hypothetical protein
VENTYTAEDLKKAFDYGLYCSANLPKSKPEEDFNAFAEKIDVEKKAMASTATEEDLQNIAP